LTRIRLRRASGCSAPSAKLGLSGLVRHRRPHPDPNVPLRIQVMPPPGMRIDGRGWLNDPVLHWETSEIECLCTPWKPSQQTRPSAPATPSRARIEVWGKDLPRLWEGEGSSTYGPMTSTAAIAPSSDERRAAFSTDRSACRVDSWQEAMAPKIIAH
jgi:hypothetical protein